MKNQIHHINHLTVYAIILLVIGLLLRYIIGKRRFNRRGVAGLQQFKSYRIALFMTVIERLVNTIATLMIIVAVVLYLIK
jgi:hypothetical protein